MSEQELMETGTIASGTVEAMPTLEEMIGALKDECFALKGAVDAEMQAHAATRGLLSQAKQMLANPAFQDSWSRTRRRCCGWGLRFRVHH